MRKKKLLLLFWVLVLILAVGAEAMLIKRVSNNWYQKVSIVDYGIEISYPRAYKEIIKEESNYEKIASNIFATLTETEKNTGITVDLVKELLNVKSDASMIKLQIEGIKKQKSPKSLEEICKDYITMFKVYNENLDIYSANYNQININGIECGRVEIYTVGKKDGVYPGIISYLFSLDDREVTVTFTGTQEIFNQNTAEINKIINSIKFSNL